MKELLRRLSENRRLTVLLFFSTVLASILALSSSLYTIQILNRYVSHGVDATLVTLTIGVVLAIALELGFRWARLRIAKVIMATVDFRLGLGVFGLLSTARLDALEDISVGERRELLRSVEQVETAFNPANLTALIDVPFAFLFLLVLALISVPVALIAFTFVVIVVVLGVMGQASLRSDIAEIMSESARANTLANTISMDTDTVRVFSAQQFLIENWSKSLNTLQALRRGVSTKQGQLQALSQSAQGLMGVAVIAVGAVLAVRGELSVGALIGCNILAARALAPVQRFAQLSESIDRARQVQEKLRLFAQIPTEPEQGSALAQFSGQLRLDDLSYTLPGANAPLFESLSLTMKPGEILVITGNSGSGKTTLARLLTGLLLPGRGRLLADGVDVQQLSPGWWRSQLMVVPQEPRFVMGTLRENLTLTRPDIDDEALRECLQRAGAMPLVDASTDGLQRQIVMSGQEFSVGERRLLALTRALVNDAPIAVFDEPTEGLDQTGVRRVYDVLIELAQSGCTLITCSHDTKIIAGATWVLDLNHKPVPQLTRNGSGPFQPTSSAENGELSSHV